MRGLEAGSALGLTVDEVLTLGEIAAQAETDELRHPGKQLSIFGGGQRFKRWLGIWCISFQTFSHNCDQERICTMQSIALSPTEGDISLDPRL
jgi:hypothetical protein